MSPHILYTVGAVCFFLFFLLKTGKKKQMWFLKKRKPCVLLNISSVAISAGLPVAVDYPVPASRVGFQQIRAM